MYTVTLVIIMYVHTFTIKVKDQQLNAYRMAPNFHKIDQFGVHLNFCKK